MGKKLNVVKELAFYVALIIYMMIEYFDLHFVTKTLSLFMLIVLAVVTFFYVRQVRAMPDSKKKTVILIIFPILAMVSLSPFVLLGVFVLSFGVFGQYERTRFNFVMKATYGVFVFVCVILVAYSGVFLVQEYSDYDRLYESVLSPDQEHTVTIVEVGQLESSSGYEYRLEDVYFKILAKENRVLLKSYNIIRFDINWQSDETVEINEITYDVN